MAKQSPSYFELTYQPPWKGVDVSLPENKIDRANTPLAQNWIPRAGELRTRPKLYQLIPSLPDNSQPTGISTFADSNNTLHTVAVSITGLWQLNSNWRRFPKKEWSLIGNFASPLPSPVPTTIQIFLNQIYFVTGDYNLWNWDGLTPNAQGGYFIAGLATSGTFQAGETVTQAVTAATGVVSATTPMGSILLGITTLVGTPDASHVWTGGTSGATFTPTAVPQVQVKRPISVGQITLAPVNTTGPLLAGGFFLGELDARLIILNTIEQQDALGKPTSNFQQRIRWSASGLPNVWDPTVNVGAGFNDELDVPDAITGFLTIGRNGFVFRVNGITEMVSISGGVLPFDFNHLWASERGIGNAQSFSIAGYGPVGCFVSTDDIYELSLGGFKKIGGSARNQIYIDLNNAISSPVASMFPTFGAGYPYLTYKISIVLPGNVMKNWCYFVEDDCWFPWTSSLGFETARCRSVATQ